jgi:L-asparaginase / beta-aspartyl-peptidase
MPSWASSVRAMMLHAPRDHCGSMPRFPPLVIAHGGAEADPSQVAGPQRAADAGLRAIREGRSALDAVVAAVRELESDERFNAGLGSDVRLDGHTIQMDACCVDSQGRVGSVAAVERILHPIDAARALVETPHTLLVGEGATVYARRIGLEERDVTTRKAEDHFGQLRDRIRSGEAEASECEWTLEGLREAWNFDASFSPLYGSPSRESREKTIDASTVGAVAWDGETFAAAGSTGGMSATLLGRVADTILPGSGLEANAHGAVSVTGSGEHVVRARLATRVLRRIEDGASPQDALQEALGWVPEHAALGMILVDAQGRVAGGGKKPMPWASAAMPAQEAATSARP